MTEPTRWTETEMLGLAARGARKVVQQGDRGITLVTMDEIAAMAAVLILSGTVPLSPSIAGETP